MISVLIDHIVNILNSNKSLVAISIKQRAKFEGWLKFELANALKNNGYSDTCVEYYVKKGKHIDIYANESFIELKTPNTSYRNDFSEDVIRPITKNVSSIIDDINKLKPYNKPGYIAFVMFPLDKKGAYQNHVKKITVHLKAHAQKVVTINGEDVLVFSGEV